MNADGQLLRSARKMNRDALTEIFDHYAPVVYNYVLGHSCDPLLADQIVGDVFAKLLDQLSSGKGPLTNLRAYLFQTALHAIVDELRSSSHKAPIELVELNWQTPDSTSLEIENRMDVKKILQAMQHLSDDQRQVVILRILEGFSLRETAAMLGKSIGCIKVTQWRAIGILRSVLTICLGFAILGGVPNTHRFWRTVYRI